MLRQLKLVSKCKVLPSDIQSECVDFSCGLTTLLQCDNTVLSVMTLSQSDLSLLLFFVLTNGSRMHKLLVRLNKMTHAGGEWSKSCLRMNRLWHVSSADNWDHDHLVPGPSCFTRRLSFFCSSCPALGPPRRWRKLFFWLFWLPVLAKCLIILNRCPFCPRWRLPLAPPTRALFHATLFFWKLFFIFWHNAGEFERLPVALIFCTWETPAKKTQHWFSCLRPRLENDAAVSSLCEARCNNCCLGL